MKEVVKLIRVRQWVKNTFLFIPLFFAGRIFDLENISELLKGFFAFSFIASSIYIINDYRDIESDKIHPRKKFRPLAAGTVSVRTGLSISALLLVSGLILSFLINPNFFFLLVAYFILNFAYSAGLKNIPILDMFIVASGFLFRIYSGGVITGLEISNWLTIMILLLALFIIIAKRRDDILIQANTGEIIRKASKSYNLEFINSSITMISAVIIVSYIMYTVSPDITRKFHSDYLYITTIFVIAGLMRYLQITFVEQRSGSPTRIFLSDRFLIITIIGWITTFSIIIYSS